MRSAVRAQLRLGTVLLEAGHITHSQLNHALELQRESPTRVRLGALLIENNFITESTLNEALSKRLNIKYASIKGVIIDMDAVKKIPKDVATKHCLIAVSIENGHLIVSINDPLNFYAIEDIKLITGMHVEVQITDKEEIVDAINKSYSELESRTAASGASATVAGVEVLSYVDISRAADDTPVVTLVNSTLFKAYSSGASDLHIEPFEKTTVFRIRVDGQIIEFLTLSSALHSSIAARIKVISGLDIAEKRAPQDGHFRAKLNDIEMNIRVSSLPTVFGEKLVLRFLSGGSVSDNAGTFGMVQDDFEKMTAILQNPHGVIYFTGPTGSGKTTTLYNVVQALQKRNVNIATIEDPVERMLPGINQSQVNNLAGLTFESGLRSILRQDPDIVMIGETRDAETAKISVRAALTGHLVLSSLHTNDAISAVVRLIDMGVEDYLLANSLVGVVAQRLVKKICKNCYTEYRPADSELKALGGIDIPYLAKGEGCHTCSNTGYKGRIAIHEILTIDGPIRNMISANTSTDEIYEYVSRENKLKTLQDSVKRYVIENKTSFEEMLRLTYSV